MEEKNGPPRKRKSDYDHTSSQRGAAYRERLKQEGGRRLTLDLDGDRASKLSALLQAAASKTKPVDLVHAWIDEAYAHLTGKPQEESSTPSSNVP